MALVRWLVLVLLVIDGMAEVEKTEDAKDQWLNTTNHDGEDKHPLLPDFVVINMTIYNEIVTLNLTKENKEDYEEIPVFIGGKWETEQWNHDSNEEFNVYSDKSKDASFTLVINEYNDTKFVEYYGFFVHIQIKYSLIRKDLHEKSPNLLKVVHTLTLHEIEYVVYEDNDKEEDAGSVGNHKQDDSIKPAYPIGLRSPKKSLELPKVKRKPNFNLIIDLLVVIDHSSYKKWLTWNNNIKEKAIESIRYYFAHVFNGVNNVYATMKVYKLSVSVISLYICQAKEKCMFTEESNVIRSASGSIDYHNVLENFHEWINKKVNSKELPRYDIAAVFTDYVDDSKVGLAYVGTVCGNSAQGVMLEKGHYDTITTTAHELGHILGCKHDESSKCLAADYFLMSALMSSKHLNNRDKLSICSIDYIKDKLKELKKNKTNCLDSRKKSTEEVDIKSYPGQKLPGQYFGPDQQCQHKFGKEYKYCSQGKDTHETICNEMTCVKANKCYTGHPIALNGTFCGLKKWCINGKCVPGNPDKIVTKYRDNCFFGDKSDIFEFNNRPMKCREILKNPKYCYFLDSWCCKTCNKIRREKKISTPDCQYGDRGMTINMARKNYGCELVLSRKHQYLCNKKPRIAENCCEKCEKVKSRKSVGTNPYNKLNF